MKNPLEAVASPRPDEARDREAMSLPKDPRTVLLSCIFTLMAFYTLYFAAELAVPLCFAVLLKLLLMPPAISQSTSSRARP